MGTCSRTVFWQMTSIILAGPLLILTGFLFPSVLLEKHYMVPQVDHDCPTKSFSINHPSVVVLFDITVWITECCKIKQKPLQAVIFVICYLCFLEINILHNTAIGKINVQSTGLLSYRGLWLWYVVLPFVGVHSHDWLYCWCRIKWAVSYFTVCVWFWNCYRWLDGNLCFSLQLICWKLIWSAV